MINSFMLLEDFEDTTTWTPVKSSFISHIMWKYGELYVRLKNGRIYRYKNSNPAYFSAAMRSKSKGNYLNNVIKKTHHNYDRLK